MFKIYLIYILINIKQTIHTPYLQYACGKYAFSCNSGQCIPFDQECDGHKDCQDGSDETVHCKQNTCIDEYFTCAYGACVNGDAECNGKQECDDNSDELSPKCRNETITQNCGTGNFNCLSGMCINQFLLCDGRKDCDDGSDETITQCIKADCPELSFRCLYGACIDGDKLCDNKVDCVDQSDEFPDLCGRENTVPTSASESNDRIQDSEKYANGCVLPNKPKNGLYISSSKSSKQQPGDFNEQFSVLTFSCDEGYQLYPNTKYLVCENKTWSNQIPQCKSQFQNETCPSKTSESVDFKCVLNGHEEDCSGPVLDGTIASMTCKQWYEAPIHLTYNTIVCRNGSWSSNIIECVPICGQETPKGTPLIVNGQSAEKGAFPWQIAVYERYEDEITQVCGGSIINPKVVISAAHCFTDYNGQVFSKDRYVLAAGKYYRDFHEIRDFGVQTADVYKIFVPESYKGINRNFAEDIAVIVLNATLKFTPFIQPICIDWTNEYENKQLIPGQLGEVSGWGYVQEGNITAAKTLKSLSVPFIDFNECYENVPEDFRPFLTIDKFCAGYKNGSSVCQGDSGGGLSFKYRNRHFLRGIVSVGPQLDLTCDSFEYGAYTQVSKFLSFITEIEVLYRP